MRKLLVSLGVIVGIFSADQAMAQAVEIICSIRNNGGNLSCINASNKKTMNAEDVANFVDAGQVAAFVTLKSRKNMVRTYMVDPKSAQYKRLADIKGTASISEIARAKSDLFTEIERKVIKLSDELDGTSAASDLVLHDPSITYDKMTREAHSMMTELEGYRKNKEKVCTSTPAFEQLSKANSKLQQTLSGILVAFQSPGTCMADFKVFKDKDGTVDLRQLDEVGEKYRAQCKK